MSDPLEFHLNTHRLSVLEANSADELKAMLDEIKRGFRIVSIYGVGSKHYAWINSDMKLDKRGANNAKRVR